MRLVVKLAVKALPRRRAVCRRPRNPSYRSTGRGWCLPARRPPGRWPVRGTDLDTGPKVELSSGEYGYGRHSGAGDMHVIVSWTRTPFSSFAENVIVCVPWTSVVSRVLPGPSTPWRLEYQPTLLGSGTLPDRRRRRRVDRCVAKRTSRRPGSVSDCGRRVTNLRGDLRCRRAQGSVLLP
jgi:hypothetical protein